jgi:rhodanese-related sulfurtransferase
MTNPLPIEIDCPSVKSLLDEGADLLLLDCREADEFAIAALPGARLLPMSELRERLAELDDDRDRRVIVFCHHGSRSLRVAAFLRQHGLDSVQSMSGGIDEWSLNVDPRIPRY